ncbi:MAG: M14 family zinc carboxypeptidase [Candidatus Uhrbacteria bacterium]|nr:M14 family zinc carboxypeptidase [Candidatus Uhrbacteria bacterium]
MASYFVINSIKVANEQARIQQEEQESRKIEKKIFGYSAKERPIEGYEIGNGTNTLLLLASIHGDEMGTTDLLNQFVEEIKANPSLISKTKKLVIIPIANPDGYYDRTDKLNTNEVNLNLNFATSDWQKYGPEGTYAGPEPFSEIESRVIKQAVEQYKPSIMISYHAFGALVSPEAEDASIALAKWYTEKTGYEYFNVDYWDYPGTATKWFVETTDKPAITVELTKDLQSDWDINKGALFELLSDRIF